RAEGFQVSTDLAVDYEYRGTAAVDLASGLIEAIDLQGAVEMTHGGASGQGIKQHGKYQLQIRSTPMEPVARAVEPPPANHAAPENPAAPNATPSPLPAAPDFAGTYRNDNSSITITP